MSVRQLAAAAQISVGYASEIEAGAKTNVSPPVMSRIAGALGCSIAELV